ncbi:MAG TPA: twin-arginine translocase subunit TatC [Gemmatimonadaceae bacterium]|jgi:sec-independent protein translocase protein TatC|nr:twin-arginine translocase subunit TatC [Gemmatimonadaceae bacterium]
MAKSASSEMPFLDHLEELRVRILWSLGAICVGVAIAFWVMTTWDVITLLERPIVPYLAGKRLIYTHPGDAFRIVMTLSFTFGVIFALPVILYQVWGFLSPALYQHEKRVVVPVLVVAALLFLAGVAICFLVIMPMILRFLMGFQAGALDPMITAADYFGFALSMALAFGAVFELPILVFLLTMLGIVTPEFLNRYRRHAIVLCMVGSALITPGADPMSLFILTIPLYLLFEASVAVSAVVARAQRRRSALAAGDTSEEIIA